MTNKISNSDLDLIYAVIFLILVFVMGGVLRFVVSSGDYSQQAENAITAQGYTDPLPLGVDDFSCNRDGKRYAGFAFEATNGNGARVNLTACKDQALWSPLGGWYVVTR